MARKNHGHIIIAAVILYCLCFIGHSFIFDFGGHLSREHNKWYYHLIFIVLFYGLYFYAIRRSRKSETSFKTLVKAGLVIVFLGNMIGTLLHQSYFRIIDETQQTQLVDHMVDERIKFGSFSNLDIFKIEDDVRGSFKVGRTILELVLTALLQFVFVIVLALIFGVKDKKEGLPISESKTYT